jgi:hypothetical protein
MFKTKTIFFCLALMLGFIATTLFFSPDKIHNFAGYFPKVFAASGQQSTGCSWGITEPLPTSDTYSTDGIPWVIDFYNPSTTATYTSEANNFLDINGDGLTDYIYAYDYHSTNKTTERCVYLNNGGGWDLVYYCKYDSYPQPLYKGDCADTSS